MLTPLVVLAGRDDTADAPSWIGDVSLIARDKMQVDVIHGLTCSLANIDAKIEAIRSSFANKPGLGFAGQREEVTPLLRGRFEPIGNMAAGAR
jgi:hypothetical protein